MKRIALYILKIKKDKIAKRKINFLKDIDKYKIMKPNNQYLIFKLL